MLSNGARDTKCEEGILFVLNVYSRLHKFLKNNEGKKIKLTDLIILIFLY